MRRTEIEERLNEICKSTVQKYTESTGMFNYTLEINYTLHFILRVIERYDLKVRKNVIDDIEHCMQSLVTDSLHLMFNASNNDDQEKKKIKLSKIKYTALNKQNVLVIKVEGKLPDLKIVFLTIHPTIKSKLDQVVNTYLSRKYYHRGIYFNKIKSLTEIPEALKVLDGLE